MSSVQSGVFMDPTLRRVCKHIIQQVIFIFRCSASRPFLPPTCCLSWMMLNWAPGHGPLPTCSSSIHLLLVLLLLPGSSVTEWMSLSSWTFRSSALFHEVQDVFPAAPLCFSCRKTHFSVCFKVFHITRSKNKLNTKGDSKERFLRRLLLTARHRKSTWTWTHLRWTEVKTEHGCCRLKSRGSILLFIRTQHDWWYGGTFVHKASWVTCHYWGIMYRTGLGATCAAKLKRKYDKLKLNIKQEHIEQNYSSWSLQFPDKGRCGNHDNRVGHVTQGHFPGWTSDMCLCCYLNLEFHCLANLNILERRLVNEGLWSGRWEEKTVLISCVPLWENCLGDVAAS